MLTKINNGSWLTCLFISLFFTSEKREYIYIDTKSLFLYNTEYGEILLEDEIVILSITTNVMAVTDSGPR